MKGEGVFGVVSIEKRILFFFRVGTSSDMQGREKGLGNHFSGCFTLTDEVTGKNNRDRNTINEEVACVFPMVCTCILDMARHPFDEVHGEFFGVGVRFFVCEILPS